MLDRLFPRSVLHALATAEEALAALDPGRAAALSDPARRPHRAAADQAGVRRPAAAARRQLPELLGSLQRTCLQASEAISARYFTYEQAVAWAQEC